jgi:type II secretion system protein G
MNVQPARGIGVQGPLDAVRYATEILVVIAVLAALVAPNVFRHVGGAKDSVARAQIEMLGAALDAYRLDNGRYPTSTTVS